MTVGSLAVSLTQVWGLVWGMGERGRQEDDCGVSSGVSHSGVGVLCVVTLSTPWGPPQCVQMTSLLTPHSSLLTPQNLLAPFRGNPRLYYRERQGKHYRFRELRAVNSKGACELCAVDPPTPKGPPRASSSSHHAEREHGGREGRGGPVAGGGEAARGGAPASWPPDTPAFPSRLPPASPSRLAPASPSFPPTSPSQLPASPLRSSDANPIPVHTSRESRDPGTATEAYRPVTEAAAAPDGDDLEKPRDQPVFRLFVGQVSGGIVSWPRIPRF